MEAQKTITIAYHVILSQKSEILGNTNEACPYISAFLSRNDNPDGRLLLSLEQNMKHTKRLMKYVISPIIKSIIAFIMVLWQDQKVK